MTPEELPVTGQTVQGNGSLSEVTRMEHLNRRLLSLASKAMDATTLNATVVHVPEVFPSAKDQSWHTGFALMMDQPGVAMALGLKRAPAPLTVQC